MPNNTNITLPEGTVGIAGSAFWNCKGLASVIIPDSVVAIEPWAFGRCSALTSVTLGKSVKSIGKMAFRDSKMTALAIPASVTSIASDAFVGCSSLTSLTVDAGNKAFSIQDGVLYNKDKTALILYPEGKPGNSFTIPKTVTSIEIQGSAVLGIAMFINLQAIAVEAGNTAYSAQDGVLYTKNMTTLVSYPPNKTGGSFVIPNTVTTIGVGAFLSCNNLTSVTIPNSVTSIEYAAFRGCGGLDSLVIPASVKSIGSLSFVMGGNRLTITFAAGSNISAGDFAANLFGHGDTGFKELYLSNGAGTYISADSGRTWAKQ
jgi:hypothetical protein